MGAKAALAFPSPLSLLRADRTSPSRTIALLAGADLFALSVVYWIAVVGRNVISPGYTLSFYLQCFPVIALVLLAFSVEGLYPGLLVHPAEEMRRVFACVTVVFLVMTSFTFLWKIGELYSRSVFLSVWAAGIPAVLVARQLVRRRFSMASWWGYSAIILGTGPVAERIIRDFQKDPAGIRIVGVLASDHASVWPHDMPPILGRLGDATDLASHKIADFAIMAVPNMSNSNELRQTIQDCCTGFRHILLVPDLPGICSMGIVSREVAGGVGFEVPQRLFHPRARVTKRILDVVSSFFLLAVLAPMFLVIAAIIKLTSKGPVLFGHSRRGEGGRVFRALKFRTMLPDADRVLAQFLDANPVHQMEWYRDRKLRNDPRITAVGKWLRRYSLDELPQLWNVLRGEMSLVGPRPIVSSEIPKYGNGYGLYTRVPPGLTGLWQVSGRNNTTYEERVGFDEYYVRNWSIWLDLYILTRTVKVVLTAEGAY